MLNEQKDLDRQLNSLIRAIKKTKIKVFWIYPNNDAGYKKIINKINKQKIKNVKIVPNYERSKFLELLEKSNGMIGNSSAGIIEASMFKIPVINIGKRQNGRPQSINLVNSSIAFKSIEKKIRYIQKNKKFINSLKYTKNPFFIKNSSEKITKILINLKNQDSLLKKY